MPRREQRTIVDGVDFGSVFQFQTIIGAIASSMQPARLIIGLMMVLVLFGAGKLWDSVAGPTDASWHLNQEPEDLEELRRLSIAQAATALGQVAPAKAHEWDVLQAQKHLIEAWEDFVYEAPPKASDTQEFEQVYLALEEVRQRGVFESSAMYMSDAWNSMVDGALDFDVVAMWKGVVAIVWELPQLLWNGGYHWFISVYGFLLVYVLCIGGGAIARMQASQHARQQQLTIQEAIGFSFRRWRASMIAVVAPAMFVTSLSILLLLGGLILMNVPMLNLIGGILYGVALLIGRFIAVIAVGYSASFPMLIPAVMVENCSGGESVQRSYAYLFSRAMHYLGYAIVLVVSLVLGYLVIRLIATLTLDLTASLVGTWTMNSSLHAAGAIQEHAIPSVGLAWYENATGALISLWETIVYDSMVGWIFSGFFSASTMMYLLMRNVCDGQPTKDIWWEGLISGTNVPQEDKD